MKNHQISDNMTGNSIIELPSTPQCGNGFHSGEGACIKQSASEQVSGCLSNEKSVDKFQPTSHNIQNEPVEVNDAVITFPIKDQMQLDPTQVTLSNGNEQLDTPSGDVGKSTNSDCSGQRSGRTSHIQLGCRKKITSKSLKKKYMLRSLCSNDRVLRSKTREPTKATESNSNLANGRSDGETSKRRRKKKKKGQGEGMPDEFTRIRAHLKYLLNRVGYEQNLIDAYSAEGWKGYSIDKLKPEKELQRAKSEILRRKLKIRDLFQHLDTLCAEGRLPESLFDSDGEIDSEDIFCAKCGSKELSTDNDIILCDGVCDRGFHQFCLAPPLLTESIPPDNESWLCPGCDCKEDCFELLNESFGTSLSFNDTWERVFPEAAAAVGNNMDHDSGHPSEDSDDDDDDDYNPDAPEDTKKKGDESNSDESDYASASEKLENPHKEDPYLGLPSDDSEDDDFNPSVPNFDKKVEEESSSSDFTSDSEDLGATIRDNMISGQDEDTLSTPLDNIKQFKNSGRKGHKTGKKQTVADELSSLLESDPRQEGSTHLSGKRNLERLDYKKLYDETYKNSESDTSDDEEWTDTATASRRKKLTSKVTLANGIASTVGHIPKETAHSPRVYTGQNIVENADNTCSESHGGSKIASSSDKKHKPSTHNRLGEAKVQRLFESFKENRYPDRATKEGLAQEVGLTFRQVDKWFTNTRWSFRNTPHIEAGAGRKKKDAPEKATCSKVENQESLGGEEGRDHELVSQECSGEKSKTQSNSKRKLKLDPESSGANLDIADSVAKQPPAGSSGAQEVEKGHRMKKRRKC